MIRPRLAGHPTTARRLFNLLENPMRLSRLFVALAPLALAACLTTTEPPAYATVEETNFAASLGVDLANSTKDPTGYYYRDIVVGTGTPVVSGQASYIFYIGNLSSGEPFDSLKAPSAPAAVTPGAYQNLLEPGIVGMRVGGRRQIIIPPSLGYGFNTILDENQTVLIPANSVLVFTVDVVDAAGNP